MILRVSIDGNDGRAKRGSDLPFASLRAAVQAALAGDTVEVGTGLFPLGKTPLAVNRVRLVGFSAKDSVITAEAPDVDSFNRGMVLRLTGEVEMVDLTITALTKHPVLNADGWQSDPFQYPIWCGDADASVILNRVRVIGTSDAILAWGPGVVRLVAVDCDLQSEWDVVNVNAGPEQSRYLFSHCRLNAQPEGSYPNRGGRTILTSAGTGELVFTDCKIKASGGNTQGAYGIINRAGVTCVACDFAVESLQPNGATDIFTMYSGRTSVLGQSAGLRVFTQPGGIVNVSERWNVEGQ